MQLKRTLSVLAITAAVVTGVGLSTSGTALANPLKEDGVNLPIDTFATCGPANDGARMVGAGGMTVECGLRDGARAWRWVD